MTTQQKSLAWIVGLVAIYLAAAFPLELFPFQRDSSKTVNLTLKTTTSPPTCDAKPALPGRKNPQKITFKADNNDTYYIHFAGSYPFTDSPHDIKVPKNGTAGPFTVKVTPTTENDYYSLTSDGNCQQASQYIGVIVKP